MYTNEQILEYIGMPEECSRLALECLERHMDNEVFIDLKKRFYADMYVQHRLDAFAESVGEPYRMVRLAFCLFCKDEMYEIYKNMGLADKVYLDSLIDLRVWALTCMRNYGEWGMEEFKWLEHALRGKVIRLGRLQFEQNKYEYGPDYNKHGVSLKHGDPAIGVHIPEDGPFTVEQTVDSLKQAYAYFGNPAFICESWLLYPPQYDFLKPESNIIKFMDHFDIVHVHEDRFRQDMWRVFGMREKYDPKELPRDTSLRRGYAEHLEKTNVNGWGYGVLIFDGEKILTQKS